MERKHARMILIRAFGEAAGVPPEWIPLVDQIIELSEEEQRAKLARNNSKGPRRRD